VIHGALDHAELDQLGLRPEAICDFSSNLNPFGPPASVREALSALDPAPYPDRGCHRLRRALAAHHGCPPEQVLVGNGANQLIHLIARALLRPGDRALALGPTFGEYTHAVQLAGGVAIDCIADMGENGAIDAPALLASIRLSRPRLVWLCTPNNPTGATVKPAQIEALARVCADAGAALAIDRAYAAFERGCEPLVEPLDGCDLPGVLRLYSLTKSYALAGLRLGYLLADQRLIQAVAAYQPTWSVNSAAQAAGLAALADPQFLAESLPRLWRSSDMLYDGLRALGLPVLRRALPFMLVRVGDAARIRGVLLRRGFAVRDCASFGLPEYVRLAPRRAEENAELVRVWSEIDAGKLS
jgi:threonine-phosphate decarboxylase